MSDPPLLPFVQLELAGTIGVEPGRYLGRDPEMVLVIDVAGAPQPPRRRLRKGKPAKVEPIPEPPTVPLTTLTAIRPEPFGERARASAWLERLRDDEEAVDVELDRALRLINRAVHAYRIASLDPQVPDVSTGAALAVRIGFGDGEGLADGRWDEAIELPGASRRRRLEAIEPQARIAAVLSGRERPDAFTGALLRARSDLDAGRGRDAALALRVGLEALLADRSNLAAEGQQADLAELEQRRTITGEAANEALRGPLSGSREAEVSATLRTCERVLRRRRAYG